jgi:carboxypeptidase T
MITNIMLEFLHAFVHQSGDSFQQVFEQKKVYFVPIVNVDGFKYIDDQYQQTGNLVTQRKNRHAYPGSEDCKAGRGQNGLIDIGVDLNRNYEFGFDLDNQGSSSDVCSGDYRGPHPFSEPETRAIRDLVIS